MIDLTVSRKIVVSLAAATVGLGLASCSSSDPLADPQAGEGGNGETITIGTANFPESEIIGQIWAEQLRADGFDVEVTSGIGSREVYLSALESGEIDIVPEYSGNLAEFYGAEIEQGANADTVNQTVQEVLPEGLAAGEFAPGESKDAFVVTSETAADFDLTSIADLANLDEVVLAGNPELAERPYGPPGFTQVYGVPAEKITMNAISDGGGPLTVAALLSGEANVADIYSTSPHLDSQGNEVDLVTLEDPENLVLPQNVLPIYRADAVPQEAIDALNGVNKDLTTADLEAMNLRNVGEEKAEPVVIASDYLKQ
ncbi:ABC transporter substrate-binding protein [Corynebacterium lubricantis]|uniref:ABC transporter substrate-binding protein n=1 Tax=Corynebacterium lubricantis TaxID=541095 RepID=UPI00037021CE|nr:ABC transporter substrate-binding protein [Corynebacterium lubricantis]